MTTGTTHDQDATSDAPRFRASDAERAATVDSLKDAVTHGLLTPDEGSERMAATFAARFREELPPLTADLPPQATPAVAVAVGWRSLAATLVAQLRYELHATRAAGVRSRRGVVAGLVAVLLLGIVVTLAVHGLWDGGHGEHGEFDER